MILNLTFKTRLQIYEEQYQEYVRSFYNSTYFPAFPENEDELVLVIEVIE